MNFKRFLLFISIFLTTSTTILFAQEAEVSKDTIISILSSDSIPSIETGKIVKSDEPTDSAEIAKILPNIDEIFQTPPPIEAIEENKDSLHKISKEKEHEKKKDSIHIIKKEEIEIPNFSRYITDLCKDVKNDSSMFRALESLNQLTLNKEDSTIYFGSPFFSDLVYMGLPLDIKWKLPTNFTTFLHTNSPRSLDESYTMMPLDVKSASVYDIRKDTRSEISRTRIDLYASIFTKLPSPSKNKSTLISTKPLKEVKFVDENISSKMAKKLEVQKPVAGPWKQKANAMIQFSQNYVSDNWHQGGSGNMAVLGILTGQLNYNNKKNVQWENNSEWRAGFMNVDDTTALRMFNTNDDILKINSKFGLKASGNWFYSSNMEFSTQFFMNYKAVNSEDLKTKFLTPVRMTLGVGMDYKYKDILSLMIAPVAYKFVYANDTTKINQNSFGVETGKKALNQIGSSLTAQFNYSPFRELQVSSKFKFYTNYEKVEVDWEIVGNFMVNRFLTTRISLNPRYDNTVIMAGSEKARIQFKELMSFGFSFRLH